MPIRMGLEYRGFRDMDYLNKDIMIKGIWQNARALRKAGRLPSTLDYLLDKSKLEKETVKSLSLINSELRMRRFR